MTRVWFTALAWEKTLITMHLALKVDVIGPENILFAGMSLHLSTGGNFTGWSTEGVNCSSSYRLVSQSPASRP